MTDTRWLGALGLLQVAVVAAMGWFPGARATPVPSLLLWVGAWTLFAAGGARVRRSPDPPRRRRMVIWGVALLARGVLLPLEPHFSDDVWRYMWDGWVGLQGVNPYLHPPSAAALEPLRTSWHHLVNHPAVPTIYPPGAQLAFLLLGALGPGLLLYKAAFTVADLAVGWILERLDRGKGSGLAALLWLWCPLVWVEVAWSGHMDPLGIIFLVAALWALRSPGRGPGLLAGGLLGIGASVKFAPALGLPALWRRRGAGAAAAGLLVAVLLVLPYAGAGPELVAGLGEYASRWRFNAGLFLPLEDLLGTPSARIVAASTPVVVAGAAAARGWSVERALFWAVGAGILLAPTLHPWYVLWILPLAILRRNRAWLVLAGTVFFAYAGLDVYRATGRWPHPPAVRLLVHAPFLAVLALEAGRALRSGRDRGDTDRASANGGRGPGGGG